MMRNLWNGNSFESVGTDESSVNFVFSSRETIIDIEPITINIGMSEFKIFTDAWILSSEIIRTRRIGWFVGIIPSFEE